MDRDELRNLKVDRHLYGNSGDTLIESYEIVWGSKSHKYEHLGCIWEPYGDTHYYRNIYTGEIVTIYYSIGD